jgi:prepilin-type N-terminal cleavage/methylation domain-containing protein
MFCQRNSAFSLLEMMIVIAIMGALTIAVPSIYQWIRYQGVGHAADQLRSDLQLARLMAISRKQVCMIEFNTPGPGQYRNSLSNRVVDLRIYRGGVHFMAEGPDRNKMSSRISFNNRGMAVPAGDIYLSNQDHSRIYRLLVLMPGSISLVQWSGERWH